MTELAMENPPIQKVMDNQAATSSLELAFPFYNLWTCSHLYAMVQRKVLDDNEWAGWLQWMRNCFRKGSIKETWKQIESDRWFNPAIQNFINTDMFGAIFEPNQNNNKIRPAQIHVAFLLRWPLISSKTASWFALTTVSWWSSSSSFEVKLYTIIITWRQLMDTTGLYLCRH
jgi:hypothetical protein